MKAFLVAAFGLSLAAAPVHAQQQPDLTRFRMFADALVGTWHVTVRDLDEKGNVTWEGRQKRVFAYTLANEFLEERALVRPAGLDTEVTAGLHMLSFDPPANMLIQNGFWPGQPGVLFTAEAALSADNRSADGTITMPSETGVRHRRRLEIRWSGADELAYRTYGAGADGKEYLNEELVYRRAPKS